MLHKGKLVAALHAKHGQFSHYDGSFNEQLVVYQQALETLYQRYTSSAKLEQYLPPNESGMPSAGARPSIEFDRWLVSAAQNSYHGPVFPFGRTFTSHEQTRQWAECIEGVTTIAVDGSQLMPWRDASIPVALVQVGFFVNPHTRDLNYTKDVRMDVLTPEDLMEDAKNESEDPDNYPYSEMKVTLRRYLLEVQTLCDLMHQWAEQRRADDPIYSPIVFFDGSLVVSFALAMPERYRQTYIDSAVALLQTSEELRVPLIGYIDTSYARDTITMLRRLDANLPEPQLNDTKRIHDALLWRGKLRWGDRTPAMICARNDVLASYGPYRDAVAFCYLQTSTTRPPTRLEFPRWMVEEGMLEPVIDAIRAETIAGNGYPYAIETADAVSVITMQDRQEFYAYFQAFMERQGIKFSYSTKSLSKNRRR
jgi:NurA domain.